MSDSFDILAFAPAIIDSGGSNLIPSGNSRFGDHYAFIQILRTQGLSQ
jgi:hypothetical protein